ncbi:MAG: SEC-C metal-binding domain-containing protein, partial [Chloroflexota bacterium]
NDPCPCGNGKKYKNCYMKGDCTLGKPGSNAASSVPNGRTQQQKVQKPMSAADKASRAKKKKKRRR